MIKEIKLSDKQLEKISQLKLIQNELEMQLSVVLQREQDIIDLIADYNEIKDVEKVDFKEGMLIFTIKKIK